MTSSTRSIRLIVITPTLQAPPSFPTSCLFSNFTSCCGIFALAEPHNVTAVALADLTRQSGARAGKTTHHCADRNAERVSRFLVGLAFYAHEHHHDPLFLRQLADHPS